MIKKLKNYLLDVRDRQQMAIALAKGDVAMRNRCVDLKNPTTWEFSGFSQNGEDGLLEVLRKQLISSNRYFVEIGSADGMQNNSSWLVVAEQYAGLMVEGNPELVDRAKRLIPHYSIGAECVKMFVNSNSIQDLKTLALHSNPDIFSLDIDGVDYYVAEAIFDVGFRPKIFVVEYNSVFGPERSMTVPYKENFSFGVEHSSRLYYGVSISAWRKFFDKQGYRFVTVDSKGVNAFFVDSKCFYPSFLDAVVGVPFNENLYQLRNFRGNFEEQFKLIEDQRFVDV
jgi:hypothetical protein